MRSTACQTRDMRQDGGTSPPPSPSPLWGGSTRKRRGGGDGADPHPGNRACARLPTLPTGGRVGIAPPATDRSPRKRGRLRRRAGTCSLASFPRLGNRKRSRTGPWREPQPLPREGLAMAPSSLTARLFPSPQGGSEGRGEASDSPPVGGPKGRMRGPSNSQTGNRAWRGGRAPEFPLSGAPSPFDILPPAARYIPSRPEDPLHDRPSAQHRRRRPRLHERH